MKSLNEVNVRLLEDGLTIPRVRICYEAVQVIQEIGRCYHFDTTDTLICVPLGVGIVEKPESLIEVLEVTVSGEPHPINHCQVRDGNLFFDASCIGKTVKVKYLLLPVSVDGWPLVHDAIIDPVVLRIEHRMIRTKLLSASLQSKPTNNMIIASVNNFKQEYHRMISHARATISQTTEASVNVEKDTYNDYE